MSESDLIGISLVSFLVLSFLWLGESMKKMQRSYAKKLPFNIETA